jgi:leader peptidase (prepilin peptidase)/N-methyltransferase
MEYAELAAAIFLGLVFGSFATALSYRIPRGISIVRQTRSHCPACQHTLGVRDLVPLFSWLCLGGKCRLCRAPIGWRYPLIELATLFVCLLFYFFFGVSIGTLPVFILAPLFVSIVDIDLSYKIIPDGLNLAVLLTGIAALLVNAVLSPNFINFIIEYGVPAALGSLLYGGGALLLRWLSGLVLRRETMGLGDIKFYAAAGFWLGINPEAAAFFMIISGLCGIILALFWKKLHWEAEVPFGPSLVIALIGIICYYPPLFLNL